MPANFNDNFRPAVALKKADTCSLKRHCRGCLREVMGYLDLLAENHPKRFVFVRVNKIAENCNKFREAGRPAYKLSMVKKTLAFAREYHLISQSCEDRVQGVRRTGFYVTDHDSLFQREGSVCRNLVYDDPEAFAEVLKLGMEQVLKKARAGTPPGTPAGTSPGTPAGTPSSNAK